MPGIFSPTLETSGTAIGVVGPAGNNIGDAINSVGNLLGTVLNSSGGSDARDTQTDRDNETLRPFIQRAINLKKQRDSGQLPMFAYRSMAEDLADEAVLAVPSELGTVQNSIHQILGLDVNLPEVSPEEVANAAFIEWSQTPRGQYYATRASTYIGNPDGTVNAQLSQQKYQEYFLRDQGDMMELGLLKQRVETKDLLSQERGLAVEEGSKVITARHNKQALEQVSDLAVAFSAQLSTGDPLDGQAVLSDLNRVITGAEALYTSEMAALGVDKNQLNTELALAPLYALRSYIETRRDNLPKLAQSMKSIDEMTIRKIMQEELGFGPLTDEGAFIFENRMYGNLDQIRSKSTPSELRRIREGILSGSGSVEVQEDNDGNEVRPGSVEELVGQEPMRQLREMPEEDRRRSATGMFTVFNTIPLDEFNFPETRTNAVKSFLTGVAAVNSLDNGGVVTVETLKTIYSPDFFKRYEFIAKEKDMDSAAMRQAVRLHLYQNLDTKATLLERDFSQRDGTAGLRIGIENGNLVVVREDDISKFSKPTRSILDQPKSPGQDPFVNNRILQSVEDLNSIYQIMKKFPDLKDSFVKDVTKRFTKSSPSGLNFVEARSLEEFKRAPVGSIVLIYNENGELSNTVIKE